MIAVLLTALSVETILNTEEPELVKSEEKDMDIDVGWFYIFYLISLSYTWVYTVALLPGVQGRCRPNQPGRRWCGPT